MTENSSASCRDDAAFDDPRVHEAMREYQRRMDAGEPVERGAFLAAHADLADVLAPFLEVLEFMHGVLGEPDEESESGAPPIGADPVRPGQPLGDYQLVRELGRGGMGVVYEAVQLSLGRRVAVKILPFAAALDARRLQRFRNEAQAAAGLHHPHIVPVHGFGIDRGVHYYAMQYIEGHTLADIIANLRQERDQHRVAGHRGSADYARFKTRIGNNGCRSQAAEVPTVVLHSALSGRGANFFRWVAGLGIQAAEALEHAHQLGVIHRDIKPANLLVDSANCLWITDFGLARCRAEQELTCSGDLVGTLRYMSPEQALARHGLVDQRSDIYSLGATLHELLCLEPVYAGHDREEILRQIAWDEPRPLRRVNAAIPVALETIMLKALAREPERRYASAADLADDLRRFLDDRPILARRPTLRDRLVKWARRHRAIVWTLTAAIAVVMAGMAVALNVLWHEQEHTTAALADAKHERQRAEDNFRRALEGVDQLLWQLEDPRWAAMPGLPKLRTELSRQALRFLQGQFVRDDSSDPAVRFESGRVYLLLANIHCGQQETGEALEALQRAVEKFGNLVAEQPNEPTYRRLLAETYCLRGTLRVSMKEPEPGEDDLRNAIAQYRRLASLDPTGDGYNRVAWLLADCPIVSLRQPGEAVRLAREAVAREPEVGRYWNTLGVALYRDGHLHEALTALTASMTRTDGGEPVDWFFLAMTHSRLGDSSAALRWFGKGAQWLRTHPPQSDEWFRAGAEAAAMLGQKTPLPPDLNK